MGEQLIMDKGGSVSKGLFWKFLERIGVQGTQFVLQLVLARLLDPEHYGVLSMMVVFTTLANVFIQRGFNTALIQNQDVTEEDYSSVFWVTMGIAAVLYVGLFAAAPYIAEFYRMPDLIVPFRALCLVLFPGGLNSIQIAKISRNLEFKKVFMSNVAAIIIAGISGIVLAYMGAGLWALVAQNMLNVLIACIVMWFTVKWRPRLICNFSRIKELFSYGWKLLVSGLLDTLYGDLRSLVIGRKYSSGTLGYYNRGKQFPQFIINAVNTTVQSVMLPAMSAQQDSKDKVKAMMCNSITLSSYIIFPVMAGLACVAEPLVKLLLTEKWLPCVPYMQIYCFTLALYPVHSCNLQAINAMGRSDVFLKLEVIKKSIGIIALCVAVFCFDSPIAIAMTGVFTGIISSFINAYPNKALINYSYREQMMDILPSMGAALFMGIVVMSVNLLNLGGVVLIIAQVIVGAVAYTLVSIVFRLRPYSILMDVIKTQVAKR